jgi:hypothetical protein
MTFQTYTTAIPGSGDNPSVSQGPMAVNCTSIANLIAIDHFGFNNNQGGYHNIIHQPFQSPSVDPAPLAGIGQTYVKTVGSDQQLFYESGNGVISQITSPFTPLPATNGFSYLPGGILIQWGLATTASGSTITFPTAFSTAVYNIQCSIFQNTTNRHFVYARTSTLANFVTTQLDSGGSAETNTFNWVAIGK